MIMKSAHDLRTRGFTLIELLTVIAIIGILSAFLLPALIGAKQRARSSEVTRMVKDLEMAIRNFYFDYNQHPWDPATVVPMDPASITVADAIRELAPSETKLTLGNTPTINTQLKDYLTIPAKFARPPVGGGGSVTLVDIWGSEYMIMYNADDQKVIIWSKGEDTIDDTGDGDNIYGDDVHNQ